MTKSRKIGITLAFALVFVLACAVFIPLYSVGRVDVANAAPPVITDTASTWENTYNGTYYNNLNDDDPSRYGATFYDDLASLITKTHTHKTSYDEVKEVFITSDADPDKKGNIIWFYSGSSVPYKGTMLDSGYATDREHVWPKMSGDAFPEKSDAGGDAHHLRPTNNTLNNARSNYQFGEVPQTPANKKMQGGNESNYGTSDPDTWCYLGSVNGETLFYPAKGYRGATARIMFYVQTRWGKGQKTGDLSFTLGRGSTRVFGHIDTLMKWHLEEPPTDQEIRRNNVIAGIQGNRNPFIDHPEYAEMIYCYDGQSYNNALKNVVAQYGSYLDNSNGGGGEDTPKLTDITLSQTSLNMMVGDTSNKIIVTAVPEGASNVVTWSTSNSNVATVNSNNQVVAVGAGTATITATSAVNKNIKATLTVNVTAVPKVLQSISISPGSFDLTLGATRQLTVTAEPQGASNSVTWSSSDNSIVSVTQAGLVTAQAKGTATITATSTENRDITASITVTVISAEENTQAFLDSLEAIENATSLQAKYNAIKRAIDAYNQMSEHEQTTQRINGNYDLLQQAIADYNEEIGAINGEFTSANSIASQLITGGAGISFVALLIMVIERLMGGN